MAETNFTRKFKIALASEIEQYLIAKKISKNLKVITEYSLKLSDGSTTILDIAIINGSDKGLPNLPNRIVGVEMEIRSGQQYIEHNYEKFNSFVEDKASRIGSLIQLFTEKTNISSKKYQEIFEKSKNDMSEIKGFSYAMRDFTIYDES